jgi:hypothetical protein
MPVAVPVLCFAAFFVTSYLRNPYGELVRALGMTLILVLRQSREIRRQYPSWRHLPALLRVRERSPFPPSPNPWTYQPRSDARDDPEFNMLSCVVALAVVGSMAGGNVPFLPSWMGALAGGALLAFAATLPTATGDLVRCMGMRAAAVAREAWILQSELRLLSKAGTVAGKIADKVLVLDRKHRIKDRVISGASFLYDQVIRATQQQQQQQRRRREDRASPPRRRQNDYVDTPDRPPRGRPGPPGNNESDEPYVSAEETWRQPHDSPTVGGRRPIGSYDDGFDAGRSANPGDYGRRAPPPGLPQW